MKTFHGGFLLWLFTVVIDRTLVLGEIVGRLSIGFFRMTNEYIVIPLIGLFAFFVKGVVGTGPTTVIVALGSLVIEPKSTVVLSSLVNIFGGLAMLRVDPVPLALRYWLTIAITMVLGSFVGAMTLEFMPKEEFQIILAVVCFVCSFWFLLQPPRAKNGSLAPESATLSDSAMGLFGGFCGGFVGINAPPLVLYFGHYLAKSQLRRLLVLIFLPAAIAQTGTFYWNGMLTSDIMLLGLSVVPTMLIGVYLGNLLFHRISETWFRKALGVLLVIVSSRLLLKTIL